MRFNRHGFLRPVFALALAGALAPAAHAAPAPSPVPSSVVWFDLDVSDIARSQAFYGPLFGWTFAPGNVPGMDFVLIKAGDAEIGTLDKAAGAVTTGSLSVYFPVTGLAATYQHALALGATGVFGPMPVPGDCTRSIALFKDPDGHPIGIVASERSGDCAQR